MAMVRAANYLREDRVNDARRAGKDKPGVDSLEDNLKLNRTIDFTRRGTGGHPVCVPSRFNVEAVSQFPGVAQRDKSI